MSPVFLIGPFLAIVLAPLCAIAAQEKEESADRRLTEEMDRLQGTWVVVKENLGGERLETKPLKGGKVTWQFKGNTLISYKGSESEMKSTFSIDPVKTPGHLDVIPSDGDDRTPIKCLYSLVGDDLKIAFTADFSPGTKEDEERRLKQCSLKRPERVEPVLGEPILSITLKREKQK